MSTTLPASSDERIARISAELLRRFGEEVTVSITKKGCPSKATTGKPTRIIPDAHRAVQMGAAASTLHHYLSR